MDAVDLEHKSISKTEFRDLILHMAAADLHTRRVAHKEDGNESADWAASSWEEVR